MSGSFRRRKTKERTRIDGNADSEITTESQKRTDLYLAVSGTFDPLDIIVSQYHSDQTL